MKDVIFQFFLYLAILLYSQEKVASNGFVVLTFSFTMCFVVMFLFWR